MDISDLSGSYAANSITELRQVVVTELNEAAKKANTDYGNPMGTSVAFSKPSELLSKIEQLKNENPEKFKDVMRDIASLLRKASEDAAGTNSDASKYLGVMAGIFRNIADTGDASKLQPTKEVAQEAAAGHASKGGGASKAASTCIYCGATIPEGSTVCPRCGMPVPSTDSIMNLGQKIMEMASTNGAAKATGAEAKTEDAVESGELARLQSVKRSARRAWADNAIAQYLSDASSGSQKTLLEALTSQNDGNGNAALKSARDLLLKALETA